jgi:hypothetical protein
MVDGCVHNLHNLGRVDYWQEISGRPLQRIANMNTSLHGKMDDSLRMYCETINIEQHDSFKGPVPSYDCYDINSSDAVHMPVV